MTETRKFASDFERSGDAEYHEDVAKYFEQSIGSNYEKLDNFAKFTPRQTLARFLYRSEVFQRIEKVQGSIVELGVLWGGGIMSWAQLSAIYEPLNYQRKIIGFDSFAGFSELADEDKSGTSQHLKEGGLAVDSYDDLQQAITLYDQNRFLGHIPKVELVPGDIMETLPQYLQENPHTVVSLLNLDVDVYEPTKCALELLAPRMPKGAVIMFDELNTKQWPGETVALLDSVGISNLRIERVNYQTVQSYAVLE